MLTLNPHASCMIKEYLPLKHEQGHVLPHKRHFAHFLMMSHSLFVIIPKHVCIIKNGKCTRSEWIEGGVVRRVCG